MEFHIARSLRERLALDEVVFSYTGNVVFANLTAARKLAAGLNVLEPGKEATIHGGALFAMGLVDEMCHAVIAQYREEVDPDVTRDALKWFETTLGQSETDGLLLAFATQFPPTALYNSKTLTPAEWLAGSTDGVPHRETELEELLLLWLANINPALQPLRAIFADDGLKQQTAYPHFTASLETYFETRPLFSAEAGTLFEALLAPILASPDSLTGQLEFIRKKWSALLGAAQVKRALLAIDTVKEEDVAIWMRFHPAPGNLPQRGEPGWQAHGFSGDEYTGYDEDFVVGADGIRRARRYSADHQAPLVEYEAFSQDQAWMPNVVMMAKSTYVWLEQLSKKYLRHIHRLDQIPDEELRTLADRGMTALWLIGLWERSVASRTIKRLRGQADAVASAYSLKEYNIAHDLGGNEGYERLRDRAAAYGLRLASDMVPNHMGIDSVWVVEHPEWFITRNDSPFPVYTFNGPDVSQDRRAEIRIEDHYYDQTDAAVAFQMKTHADNRTQYIYHGNDGTTFAWNDTAQLDYSKAAVREHVMQTILHVARLFPIIRFDAAMVLAKRHVQRLWFPLPGVGGSIPSRAEYAMSQEEFDALMPNEFWREVVDRVAVEVPGTLLLAEAFWLLEGYFVRTLGMHRVYNSAFMNMLRDEENAKYRSYLKKTLEFDPEILKRYVNFMSNPDEKTAADQFGSGDKHFGTCTLLATLPGLPMFAHGQIEGFAERYGMDFKEAKMQEIPDQGLMDRYQREITPLLHNRSLFTESHNFVLYDFYTGSGSVDENVIAYSNRAGDERAVILYNNTYGSTHGTIRTSVAAVDKGSGQLRQKTFAEALGLPHDDDTFLLFRESNRHLDYIRRASDLRDNGLTVPLNGYQYTVLQNWRDVRASAAQPWDQLCDSLHGAGVPNLQEAFEDLRVKPLHDVLRTLLTVHNADALKHSLAPQTILQAATMTVEVPGDQRHEIKPVGLPQPVPEDHEGGLDDRPELGTRLNLGRVQSVLPGNKVELESIIEVSGELHVFTPEGPSNDLTWLFTASGELHRTAVWLSRQLGLSATFPAEADFNANLIRNASTIRPGAAGYTALLAWIVLESLLPPPDARQLFDQLKLRNLLADVFASGEATGGPYEQEQWRAAARVRAALARTETLTQSLQSDVFWNDSDIQWLTGVSTQEGITYVSRQKFESLLIWLAQTTGEDPKDVSYGNRPLLFRPGGN